MPSVIAHGLELQGNAIPLRLPLESNACRSTSPAGQVIVARTIGPGIVRTCFFLHFFFFALLTPFFFFLHFFFATTARASPPPAAPALAVTVPTSRLAVISRVASVQTRPVRVQLPITRPYLIVLGRPSLPSGRRECMRRAAGGKPSASRRARTRARRAPGRRAGVARSG